MRVTSISLDAGPGSECVRLGMDGADLFLHGSYDEIRAFAQAILDAVDAYTKDEVAR